ncbi:MAG: efflux RND transporter periplasmic adaptor subunit [Planctomycetota bacterium]|nr:efflux RND transporter periplasmic adaptor subunit [Planctomycetota bacterium]
MELRAPFAGTIERRSFSPSERVAAGDGLLTLADTSTLWVAADIREREWKALILKTGDEILVESASADMKPIKAAVHFVGREVDPTTNAIPLVAVVDNPDGRLRPGMFVRVTVPLAHSREALSIPESAILEHDNRTFVFSPENDGKFRRIDIIPGLHVEGFVEVISGLNAGQQIVSSGGFYLKSELLLAGEE